MDHPWQHKPNSSPFDYHHDHAFLSHHPPNPLFDTHPPPPKKMEKKLDKIINTNGDDHTHLAELLNALPMEESLKEEEGEEEEEEFVSNIKHGHCSIDGGGAHNDNDNVSVIINANVRSKRKKRLASVNSSTRTNTWTKTHINIATHSSVVGNPLVCQIEGCINGDLRKAKKDYHRRHKVCEMHSKAPLVIKAGVAQRFCQQCSRFHVLSEFDDAKRSCRRRLEGHNRRRRKPTYSPTFIASAASLLQLGYHDKIQQLLIQHHGHQISTPTIATNMQQLKGVGNATPFTMVASNPLHYISDIGNKVYTIVNHDGLSSSPSLLHLQHEHHATMPTYGANNIGSIIQGKGAFPTASGDVCAPSCALSLLSSHPQHLSTNHQYITSTNESSVTTLQDVIKIPNLNYITYHQDNHINSIHSVGGLLDSNNGPTLTMSSMSHMRKDKPFFMVSTNEGHYDSEMARLGYSWS